MYSQTRSRRGGRRRARSSAERRRLASHFRRQPARDAGGRRRAFPADHRLQRHLRLDRRRDPAVRGRLDRPVDRPVARPGDRRRRPVARSRPLLRRRDRLGPGLFFTAKRRMALPSILLLLAFVGGVFATAGVRAGASASANRARRTMSALGAASSRPCSAALAAGWPPGSTGGGSRCRSPSPPAPPPSRRSSSR